MPTCIEKLSKSKRCHSSPPRQNCCTKHNPVRKPPVKSKEDNFETCCNNCCSCNSTRQTKTNEDGEYKLPLKHNNSRPLNVNLKLQLVDDGKPKNSGCLCAKYFEMLDACFSASSPPKNAVDEQIQCDCSAISPNDAPRQPPSEQSPPPPPPPAPNSSCWPPGLSSCNNGHPTMQGFFPPPPHPMQHMKPSEGCKKCGGHRENPNAQNIMFKEHCNHTPQQSRQAVNAQTFHHINNTLSGITGTLQEIQKSLQHRKGSCNVTSVQNSNAMSSFNTKCLERCVNQNSNKSYISSGILPSQTVGRCSLPQKCNVWPILPKRLPPPPPPVPPPFMLSELDDIGLVRTIPEYNYISHESRPTMITEPMSQFSHVVSNKEQGHPSFAVSSLSILNKIYENKVLSKERSKAPPPAPPMPKFPLSYNTHAPNIGFQEELKLKSQSWANRRTMYSPIPDRSRSSPRMKQKYGLKQQVLPLNDNNISHTEKNNVAFADIKQHIEEVMKTRRKGTCISDTSPNDLNW